MNKVIKIIVSGLLIIFYLYILKTGKEIFYDGGIGQLGYGAIVLPFAIVFLFPLLVIVPFVLYKLIQDIIRKK